MKSIYFIITLFFMMQGTVAFAGDKKNAAVKFYGETVAIRYDVDMTSIPLGKEISEETFKKFYYNINNTQYISLLGSLLHYKSTYQLNDWLYYLLINETTATLLPEKSDTYKTLFNWFLLQKSGYRVQLNHAADKVNLAVYTLDEVKDKGFWVDIIDPNKLQKDEGELEETSSKFNIHFSGKAFSFNMKEMPTLNNPEMKKELLRVSEIMGD